MTENIELKPLRVSSTAESDTIDEYNEIKQVSTAYEQLQSLQTRKSNKPLKVPNQVDFFTQFNVKPPRKHPNKKTPSNLMDVIQTELAAREAAIEKNSIAMAEFSTKQQNSYLEKPPKLLQIFETRRSWYSDAERGWSQQPVYKLSPIFPRVMENIIPDVVEKPHLEYVQPVMFDDFLHRGSTQTKFLDIELENLKFYHHHYFSLEKILAEKLVLAYTEHLEIKKQLDALSTEVKINRETKDNLQRELTKISQKKEDVRFDQTVRKFTGQMIELKFTHMDVIKKERELLNKVISIWSDIELVREKTGVALTPFVMDVRKVTMSDDEFDIKWTEMYNREFSDLLDSIEYDFVSKYIDYKEKKSVKTTEKLIKPKMNIDEEYLKEQAEKNANNIFKRETVDIKLVKRDNMTQDSSRTSKLIYSFRIYIDDIMACESDPIANGKDFEFEFFESFSLQILPENKLVRIALIENDEEVSNAKFIISEITKNIVNTVFDKVNLVYKDNTIEPNTIFVGSGYNIKDIASMCKVRLKSCNAFKGNLCTNCEVKIKVGWNEKLKQNNCEIKSFLETDHKLKRLLSGVDKCNIGVLQDVIEKIYDQDISGNDEIMDSLIRISRKNIKTDDDTFEIDENSAELIRIKLLHLRNQGELSTVENKRIPLYASQISTEQLNALQKHKEKEFDLNTFNPDKYKDMDQIEMQRLIGVKYIENLNTNLMKTTKTRKDIVCDFQDLSLRSLFTNRSLTYLASIKDCSRRPTLQEVTSTAQDIHITVLRAFNLPDRTPSALTEESDANDSSIAGFKVRSLRPFVKVQYQGITVQTATAIGCHPTWNQTLKIRTKPGRLSVIHISIYDEQKINMSESYSEAGSQDRSVHYRCHNRWLGTLEVPLYSVFAFGKIKGTFKIYMPPLLLGYESYAADKDTNRSLIPEVTQLLKKETSFLSLQITSNHIGGVQNYGLPQPASSNDDYVISHLNKFLTEFQVDFSTRIFSLTRIDSSGKNRCVTQFLQPVPMPDYNSFPKDPKRTESAVSKTSNLSKSSSSRSTEYKRNLNVERAQDVEKESLYSGYETRSWKKGDNPIERMINVALRYVSLIPCYEVTESHVVTLMGVELLRVLNGSPTDHAILLASYFLHLGVRTWVVVGFGLPRGRSTFVVTKYDLKSGRTVLLSEQAKGSVLGKSDGFEWHVYEATSGEKFPLRDVSCPLKKVDYVFDSENIWVNVQVSQDCENVSFNFMRSSEWRPVFDKEFFLMKYPIATDAELYSAPGDVAQLKNSLESKIKLKIQKWRPHMKTIWNRYCSSLLRESLASWENWAWCHVARPTLGHRMKQLMLTRKVHGFPLNVPFASERAVFAAVKASGAHVNDDPNVEFALALEVYAYPNNVLSVWVYLATVARLG